MRISTRLLFLILLATVPLVAVQVYNEWSLRAAREREIRSAALRDAQMLSHELARLVGGMELLLASLSHTSLPVDRPDACNRYMQHLAEAFPLASNIGISDTRGRVLCLNTPFERGRLYNTDRRYFRRALETRRFAIGEYIVGRATGRRVLAFGSPIFGADGRTLEGVAYASINLEALGEELLKRPLPRNASVTIADAEGTVLVRSPERDRVGGRLPAEWMTRIDGTVPRVVNDEPMFGDVARVVGYVPLALPPHGLFVAVGLDRGHAMAPINASTLRTLVTMIVALTLSVVLTVLFGRHSIRRPLERLMQAARTWKSGDLAARTGLRQGDAEFVQIGRTFDEMAQALAAHEQRRDAVEQALRQSRDEAMRASASKTQFLASVSHDLRQPLQALSMTVAVLAARLPGEEATEIAMLKRAVDNLSTMVEGMMDVVQLDAGLITAKIAAVPLDPLLHDVRDEFASPAAQHGLALTVQPSALAVRSDAVLLGRIVRNLLSNALKFTPRGGSIDVACAREGDSVAIRVRDTGIGIPAERHAQIFEEFHQIGNPERDRRKGLGLGLAIVKKLAALLDHRVTVDSEPGKGSTFTVVAPLAASAPGMRAPEPPPGIVLPRRVLLVEDDDLVAESTVDLLESWGAAVTRARSADEAYALIDRSHEDVEVAIVDYRLPGDTGLEVIARARSRWPALPAILLTGDATATLAASAQAGKIELLRKPVTVERLAATLSGLA
jgi:signal transduction histidine kinase/CheY-like chemotaxis protein